MGIWLIGALPILGNELVRYVCMLDTTPDALRAQTEAQRRLGGAKRFLTACRMSQTLRECALRRIRSEAPHLDEKRVVERLVDELYGVRRDS